MSTGAGAPVGFARSGMLIAGTCTICRNRSDNRVHIAREMMFGTRQTFRYLECGHCGSLVLIDVPSDLSLHYPPHYYSLSSGAIRLAALSRGRLHALRRLKARLALRSGRLASFAYRGQTAPWLRWFQGLSLPESVLDVGGGAGYVLANMWQQGFSGMVGCDPYLKEQFDNGELRLVKAGLAEMEGSFDVVMAHHSFEHIPDPHRSMADLKRLARRRVVITTPITGFGWREYGVNWVGLDPPRHLHILSSKGMHQLADAHGLRVARMYFEPESLYLWGSDQYLADIPLRDSRSYFENPDAFGPERVAEYKRRACELSAAGDGDVAVFLLEPRELGS